MSKKFKRTISLILSLTISVFMISTNFISVSAASKWDGYVKISSPEDFRLMHGSSKNFYLTRDIDLKNVKDWEPICNSSGSSFKGTFDGNGYAVKNLKSTKGGLFGYIENATIKNLRLVNVDIEIKKAYGSNGAIAERIESKYDGSEKGTLIENCYVTGKITGVNTAGFAGIAHKTKFINCLNNTTVTGTDNASGFCAVPFNSVYYNCINLGKIKGKEVSGITHSLITNNSVSSAALVSCYNVGNVESISNRAAGDLVNYGNLTPDERSKAVIKDCGYIGENAAGFVFSFEDQELFIFGSKQMTKSTLKKQTTYKDWDFKNIWYIDSKINNGYPILQNMLKNYNSSKPIADKEAGEYTKEIRISLSTELKNVEIYYTTDGKTPTTSSKKYTGAITVSKDTVIKTAVFAKGKIRGKVAVFNYTIIN